MLIAMLRLGIDIDTTNDAGFHVNVVGVPDEPVAKPESVCREF
ncbi:hypothetical protein [Pseudomonas moorei]